MIAAPLSRHTLDHASPNIAEIDVGAVAENVAAIRHHIGTGVWLCAALKADAYGFGLSEIAPVVLEAGADAVAVDGVASGVALRRSGVQAPILVYPGDVPSAAIVAALEAHELIGTIHDETSLRVFIAHATRRLQVFVKVDSGLQRLGVDPAAVADVTSQILAAHGASLLGAYTHMLIRDETPEQPGAVISQFERFITAVATLPPRSMRMAASSRVLAAFAGMHLEAVDPGRAVYGLPWSGDTQLQSSLRPALRSLRSRLLQVKAPVAIGSDEPTAVALSGVTRIGIIPMGKKDGLARLNAGHVLIRGRGAPLLGMPALAHCRVDLTEIPEARSGDEVVVLGGAGAREITLADVLRSHPDLDATEIGLEIGRSVLRRYVR
jgi:alanine racemase